MLGSRYRDTSLIRNPQPPQDHHKALGIGILQGPRVGRFLMSEVPLYETVNFGTKESSGPTNWCLRLTTC